MEQQDLLQDLELETHYERATAGIRFVNYLLDVIVRRVILYVISLIMINYGSTITGSLFYGLGETGVYLASYLLSLTMAFFYYTILEGSTKGLTIGKLATGTRAVMNDGSNISWQTAVLRSLSRLVPFEALSAFGGYPWHDRWTNTQVVKIRR